MAETGIQEMSQKPEEEVEDWIPHGKYNQLTNLLLH